MFSYFYIFLMLISLSEINSLNIYNIVGTSLKECKIKFHNQDWLEIDDCDKTSFDQGWSGDNRGADDLFIDYNLGDKVEISIKLFNNVPLTTDFWDYCCIYITVFVNEYRIVNEKDYIYYCTNCECNKSYGEKTF